MFGRLSRLVSAFAASFAAILLCSCGSIGHTDKAQIRPATLWVVLIDRSASVKADAPIYEDALRRLSTSVQPGDRFVMAGITGTSGADFRVSLDQSLPIAMPGQGMLDEPKEYEGEKARRTKEITETRQLIDAGVQSFLKADARASRSAIFESLLVVAPLIVADQRRRVLVVLSDMLEDSTAVNFERTAPTDASTKRLIDQQKKAHTIPNLKDVAVCVAGAVASPPDRAAAVERFWRTYFESAGATVGPGAYARTLTGCVQ